MRVIASLALLAGALLVVAAATSPECVLSREATIEVTGAFHHRRPTLEIVRTIVDERSANRDYHHRRMEYYNDPTTRLDDVRTLFAEALGRIGTATRQSISPGNGR